MARTADTLLRLPLRELATLHLVAVCPACRDERYLPLQALGEYYGQDSTLLMLIPRLRCRLKTCRRPAGTVRLRNRFPQHPGPPLVDVVVRGAGLRGGG
jgi:hypothetical protein